MDTKATNAAKERFVRITEICGDRHKGIEPLVSVSKSYWWKGVRTGQFPAPIKLSPRVSVWRQGFDKEFH